MAMREPDVEQASRWWPEMPNVWTPVGWKHHLFRFNVWHNGIILAEPHPPTVFPKRHTLPYAGLGVQVQVIPSADGALPASRTDPYPVTDSNGNRFGRQGWTADAAPVLWTEWRQPHMSLNGVVVRQDLFAHLYGSHEVITGIEPLFGWVRVQITDILESIPRNTVTLLVKLNAPHMSISMWSLDNSLITPSASAYPRALIWTPWNGKQPGGLVTEANGTVRLAAVSADVLDFTWQDRSANTRDHWLFVTLPSRIGATCDLLIPFVPVERDVAEAELALGYDAALTASNRFWSAAPDTAAHIDTPEPLVNEALRNLPRFAGVISERVPDTGDYIALVGSYNYASVWATPQSMLMHMLLDPLGYHDEAARYLNVYKRTQGVSKPPGPEYPDHPGYLSAPRSVSAIDWITDHGAILHAVATHALLSGDLETHLELIVKACMFIRDARRIEGHAGVPGLLPPASSTDRDTPEQSVWAEGWCYRGLLSAVKVLRLAGHPAADTYAQEAIEYRERFVTAYRAKIAASGEWTDRSGAVRQHVPNSFIGGDDTHPFHLDGGPLFLVFAGLMSADDPVMQDILAWFREGPNTRTYDPSGNFHQPAVLQYEISSCEPCYSWNAFHSWQLGDRQRYLECLYSLLTGGISRQTCISSEHRGGISGTQFVAALWAYLVRLAVIDDQLQDGVVHLMRLAPTAWVSPDQTTRFERMPTEYGPVSLCWRLSGCGAELLCEWSAHWRRQPSAVQLHVPPLPGLKRVVLNGVGFDVGSGEVLELTP